MAGHTGSAPLKLPWPRALCWAAGTALLYYLAARFALAYVVQPQGIASIWPPSGVLLGALLILPRRAWAPTLLLAFVALSIANLQVSNGLVLSTELASINAIESLAAALVLQRVLGHAPRFDHLRDVLVFALVAVVGVNALTAMLPAALLHVQQKVSFWDVWQVWAVADGVGMLVVAPLLQTVAELPRRRLSDRPPLAEIIVFVLALGALTAWIFSSPHPLAGRSFGFPYLLLPVLFLGALRLGPLGASLGTLIVATGVVWGVTTRGGLFGVLARQAPQASVLAAQVFVAAASLMAWIVTALAAERDRALETVRQSEARYRTLFENMAQGAFYQRADGLIEDVNPAALRFFGLSREELLSRTSEAPEWTVIDEDGHPLQPADHPSMVALREGRPVRDRVAGIFNAQRDDTVWLSINAMPQFRPGEATPFRAFVTLHDISARKQTEKELARLYEQARSAAEVKARLLQEVNHRVKNNLLSVLGLFAFERRVTPERESKVEVLLTRLERRLRSLLAAHDLLSQSEWAPMSVTELAQQVIATALEGLPDGVSVKVEIQPSALTVSPRQVGSLALILNELVTNTLKHPPRGERTIQLKVDEAGDDLRLDYRDDGSGYPNAVLGGERPGEGLGLLESLATGTLRGRLELANEGGAAAHLFIRRENLTET